METKTNKFEVCGVEYEIPNVEYLTSKPRHKIAESIDALTSWVDLACVKIPIDDPQDYEVIKKACRALAYLFVNFICQTCQGSGEAVVMEDPEKPLVLCSVCGGSGIKPDVLDRLEAEEITEKLKT